MERSNQREVYQMDLWYIHNQPPGRKIPFRHLNNVAPHFYLLQQRRSICWRFFL